MIMETHNKCWIKGYNEGIKKAIDILNEQLEDAEDCKCNGCKWTRYLKQLLEKEIK